MSQREALLRLITVLFTHVLIEEEITRDFVIEVRAAVTKIDILEIPEAADLLDEIYEWIETHI